MRQTISAARALRRLSVEPAGEPDPRGFGGGSGESRYVCFPHAGGSALAYRGLAVRRPDAEVLAVQYPGRGDRGAEPAAGGVAELAAAASVELAGLGPVVLIGCSLGAMVALETAQRLGTVRALVVAGSPAPQCRSRGRRPWDEPAAYLARAGGGATGSASAGGPALRAYVLEALRHDLALAGRYRGPEPVPLRCPIVAMRGEHDELVGDAALAGWAKWTSGPFTSATVPGSHLFPLEAAGATAFWRVLGEGGSAR